MADHQEQYLKNLYNQNLNFYNNIRGKGAISGLDQTFPYTWIYIAELIQNALDVDARRLVFRRIDDKLLFEHDGRPFHERDIEGLSTRGVSTKSAKTIGFMGVGFKSVFKSFQRVDIASNGWHFYLQVPQSEGLLGAPQRDWLGCVLSFQAE
jgi:hypothetical protein